MGLNSKVMLSYQMDFGCRQTWRGLFRAYESCCLGLGERELNVRPACNPQCSASLQETEPSESAASAAFTRCRAQSTLTALLVGD